MNKNTVPKCPVFIPESISARNTNNSNFKCDEKKQYRMVNKDKIRLVDKKNFNPDTVIELYVLNKWSSAEKPGLLIKALQNSHSLILAYYENKLVGLGNAISDGFLVVYYPHLLKHPDFQGQGIGKMIMDKFQDEYGNFHQQMLTADSRAIDFYKKCGFKKAGETEPMWIYQGNEH